MIPGEAVEAAARAAWAKANSCPWISGDHDDERWADRRVYLDDAKVMLEAAAPHLMAAAGYGPVREAAAEALRDAAEDAEGMYDPIKPDCQEWADWLRVRADLVNS